MYSNCHVFHKTRQPRPAFQAHFDHSVTLHRDSVRKLCSEGPDFGLPSVSFGGWPEPFVKGWCWGHELDLGKNGSIKKVASFKFETPFHWTCEGDMEKQELQAVHHIPRNEGRLAIFTV